MYDLIIVGGGPAGLSAAIHAARLGVQALTLEQYPVAGGQMVNSVEINNYPGVPNVNGVELAFRMREHAESLGAWFRTGTVKSFDLAGKVKRVQLEEEELEAKTVILAMGTEHRVLQIPGAAELNGHGVSYCAAGDGPFYQGSDVAVIGGGDSAVGDAIFLAQCCKKVYLVHRRDRLRAEKTLQERLFRLPNVEVIWDHLPVSIEGENQTGALRIKNVKDGSERTLHLDCVFIAVGVRPLSSLVKDQVELTAESYVLAGEDCRTSVPGVFVAGDLRRRQLREILTACADGANAAVSAAEYLSFTEGQEGREEP